MTVRGLLISGVFLTSLLALAACSSTDDGGGGGGGVAGGTGTGGSPATGGSGGGNSNAPCAQSSDTQECKDCSEPALVACENGPCQVESSTHYSCLAMAMEQGCVDAVGNPVDPNTCCEDTFAIRFQCIADKCKDYIACFGTP